MGEQFGQPPLQSPLVTPVGALRLLSPEWQPWLDTLVRAVRGVFALQTWEPGSIAAGQVVTVAVVMANTNPGDFVETSFSLDQQQVHIYGYVETANQVRVVAHNPTTGAVTLNEGTLRVRVRPGNI